MEALDRPFHKSNRVGQSDCGTSRGRMSRGDLDISSWLSLVYIGAGLVALAGTAANPALPSTNSSWSDPAVAVTDAQIYEREQALVFSRLWSLCVHNVFALVINSLWFSFALLTRDSDWVANSILDLLLCHSMLSLYLLCILWKYFISLMIIGVNNPINVSLS